jgi:acetyl-CoA carboxylase carboxyltransferase component
MMVRYQIEQESSAYFATARLWDDGIIDPRRTRDTVAIALSAASTRAIEGTTSWGIYRH